MSIKLNLDVYYAKENMPPRHVCVLVAGGLAKWTGEFWLSQTGEDSGRVLEWKPVWWAFPIVNLPQADLTEQQPLDRTEGD